MYLIDTSMKTATSLEQKSFSEMQMTERHDFQEWIVGNPAMLGEDLLIIAKEFSGFDKTNERLDLLALDKNGKLVIIENKTDDSKKDTVWQALKYKSYCAILTKSNVCEIYQKYLGTKGKAEERISYFFNGQDFEEIELNSKQRIILVAAKFRPEVISTALHLREYGMDISCIKVTLYAEGDKLFLDSKRILPVDELEEYRVRYLAKKQEDDEFAKKQAPRHALLNRFWNYALPKLHEKTGIYQNVSDRSKKDNWIAGKSEHPGIAYTVVANNKGSRAELVIGTSIKVKNKEIFEELRDLAGDVEGLRWRDEMFDKNNRIICFDLDKGISDEEHWSEIVEFLGNGIAKLMKIFGEPLKKIMK